MRRILFPDGGFDFLLSANSLYHGDAFRDRPELQERLRAAIEDGFFDKAHQEVPGESGHQMLGALENPIPA
jgi:hypothetical protein